MAPSVVPLDGVEKCHRHPPRSSSSIFVPVRRMASPTQMFYTNFKASGADLSANRVRLSPAALGGRKRTGKCVTHLRLINAPEAISALRERGGSGWVLRRSIPYKAGPSP
uniref:Uncharacterized protein n=1 Tax=Globodera rostochiensis TaxID=31243 RepID=A0A914GVL6_GLORO